MQEHPSHYKNSKNTANAKPSDIIYDDQVRLSFFYPKSELEIESVGIVDNIVNMVRLSMVSVRIVGRKATKYIVIISGMSLICPFWVSRVSFILECVNSSV